MGGVLLLAILAIVGGSRLIRGTSGAVAGVAQALAPFPGFGSVTPARAQIGATGDLQSAYGAIAADALVDWRAQFARAGQPWQDPPFAVDVPPFAGPARRAHIVWFVGERLGDWAQQLMGIPGLLEIAHRKGQISEAAISTQTDDLVGCLVGAWGRSVISGSELEAVAPPGQVTWIARGAASGVPSACAAAVTG